MSTPTVTSVKAAIKRAAAAEGLYLATAHSKGNAHRTGDVRVREGFACHARDAGLTHWRDLEFTGTLADWLRRVLTADELRAVSVNVEVSNSDPMTDYFDVGWSRVAADWDHLIACDNISNGWAHTFVYGEGSYELERYRHGDLSFTSREVEALAPSAYAARGLAVAQLAFAHSGLMKLSGPAKAGNWAELVADRAATRDRIMSLDTAALELFLVMLPDWTLDIAGLVDAVCVLVPQDAPVAPAAELEAPAQGLTEQPQALAEYLGRLLHVPKRDFAQAVWFSLANNTPVPSHAAPWADDVIKKVRRYSRA